jgi:hypothetical protein
LYLSAALKDGVCRMGRGSLGEVLPAAVKAMFAAPPATAPAGKPQHGMYGGQPAPSPLVDDFASL